MPRMKQMIKRTEVERAKAKRTCKFSKEAITKGSLCLVVYEDSRDRYCYSQQVALEMIDQARSKLDDIANSLNDDDG